MAGMDLDVAKKIRMTQDLQCQMLSALSDFFMAMQQNASKADKTEILADMEILLYLMGERMGISRDGMDRKAASKLRLGLLEEKREEWRASLLSLLNALEGK